MFGLSKKRLINDCALIVDVGSGSVGMSIVTFDTEKKEPIFLWSHREFSLMRDINDESDRLKQISTTVVNCFLELGGNGLKTLRNKEGDYTINTVQVTIAAPWTFTATKTVNLTDEHPFTVTQEIIDSLTEQSQKETLATVEKANLSKSNLELITNKSINIRVNGYTVTEVSDQKGREVEMSHVSSLVNKTLLNTIEESCSKIIPKATIETNSFMFVFYSTLRAMHPDTSEVCLVDVTKEAIELGIVRDGVLYHTTHTPYGSYTLAREISSLCNIPKEEAYSILKSNEDFTTKALSEEKTDQLNAILSTFELKISSLFLETGDTLSIPKTIFLHSDIMTESFFSQHLKTAAEEATKNEHSVHNITSKIFSKENINDSGIALSTHYYFLNNEN